MTKDHVTVKGELTPQHRAQLASQGNTSPAGYHRWQVSEEGDQAGSFEVFENTAALGGFQPFEPGWYWWACFPGCLPDGEPNGPFETAEQAYNDATDI